MTLGNLPYLSCTKLCMLLFSNIWEYPDFPIRTLIILYCNYMFRFLSPLEHYKQGPCISVVLLFLVPRVMTHTIFFKFICCLRGSGLEIWRIRKAYFSFTYVFIILECFTIPIWYMYFLIKNHIHMKKFLAHKYAKKYLVMK